MEPLCSSSLDDESIPPLSLETKTEIETQMVEGDGFTLNLPNGGHSSDVIRKQMVLICLEDPKSITSFEDPSTQQLIRTYNRAFIVPDIKNVLQETFVNEKEYIKQQLSLTEGCFNLCIFKFLLNDSNHILVALASIKKCPIISICFLDCFQENVASAESTDGLICSRVKEYGISHRIAEVLTWDVSLTEMRIGLCEKLGLRHNTEDAWKQ